MSSSNEKDASMLTGWDCVGATFLYSINFLVINWSMNKVPNSIYTMKVSTTPKVTQKC